MWYSSHVVRLTATRARTALAVAVAGALAAAGAVAVACLPDLNTLPAPTTNEAGPTTPTSGAACGDGVIQLDVDGGEECDLGDAGDAAVGCTRGCKLSCDGWSDAVTGHCYFVSGTTDQYAIAKARCTDQGGHVVTFVSQAEYALVTGRASADAGFWVGLQYASTLGAYQTASGEEPGWPRAPLTTRCDGCFAVLPDASAELAGDAGDCVGGGRDAGWFGARCQEAGAPLAVVCEREPPGTRADFCSGGVCLRVPETHTKKKYLLADGTATAAEAASACGFLGGRLAVFDTRSEREEVVREIARRYLRFGGTTRATFWIGLAQTTPGGEWLWDGKTAVTPESSPWGNAAPESDATRAGRAYVEVTLNDTYDTQLAHADFGADDGGAVQRPYLCELSP